jgi:hypothetical protein
MTGYRYVAAKKSRPHSSMRIHTLATSAHVANSSNSGFASSSSTLEDATKARENCINRDSIGQTLSEAALE